MHFVNFVARAQGPYLDHAVNAWLQEYPNIRIVSISQSQSEGDYLDPAENKFIRTTFVTLSVFYQSPDETELRDARVSREAKSPAAAQSRI